jgi:hypothetical protein
MTSELRNLYNHYKGQTCTVIGNGPSLKDVPNTFLEKFCSFGTNRIYLKFQPTFFVCVNPLVYKQNEADISKLESVKMLRDDMPSVNSIPIHSIGFPCFSYNPEKYVFEGWTVTYVCLQLAFYLGFKTVLLVGVDHKYEYTGDPNDQKYCEEDPNHFDPSYFKGQLWNNPDLARSTKAYQLARIAYDDADRTILNLTEGTELDVFQKDSILKWM